MQRWLSEQSTCHMGVQIPSAHKNARWTQWPACPSSIQKTDPGDTWNKWLARVAICNQKTLLQAVGQREIKKNS